MRFEVVTPGAFDAITLADARLHIKEPSNITAEDDLISSYITAASKTLERKTNRVIATSTLAGYLDEWPEDEMIVVNKNPITSISSVQYYDSTNSLVTLDSSDYIVDIVGNPARIYLEETPDIYTRPNAVKVNFVAGAATVDAVDERIKQFVRLIVADYKQARTDYVTGTIVSMLPRKAEDLLAELKMYVL